MVNKTLIYDFLAGYKHNSGIFINNFFRGRDYATYCADKFHAFSFEFGCFPPNQFDNPNLSFQMIGYLSKLEEMKCAYFPIEPSLIEKLIGVSEAFDKFKLQSDSIVYRGCTCIERNGVTGVVSTTTNERIAKQFSRGTVLKIHLPAGIGNISVGMLRRGLGVKRDTEDEILIPPCDYDIINSQTVPREDEPNNWTSTTKFIEISVKPKDTLSEFLKVMENPPHEYLPIQNVQGEIYTEAYHVLKDYIDNRRKNVSMNKTRVNITEDDIRNLADNNLGANIALTALFYTPGGKEAIAILKEQNMKGPDIYLLWNDKCRKDIHKMKELLCNTQRT